MNVYTTASGSSITEMRGMMEPFGHQIVEDVRKADVIFGWSVTVMDQTFMAFDANPKALRVVYNWDVYEWVWSRPRPQEYDYKKYGELLKLADEIWVPSKCTADRTMEWYGLPAKVVLCNVPYYDHEPRDGKYILNAMRDMPDRNFGWVSRAVKELNLPYYEPRHDLPRQKFEKMVAGCTFIVNEFYEGSTGGLSLIEAYYLGKPGLISDSPYMGGNEYLPGRVRNFKHDDYEDLKVQLKDMWLNTPSVAPDHKQFVVDNYSRAAFAKRISECLKTLDKKQ